MTFKLGAELEASLLALPLSWDQSSEGAHPTKALPTLMIGTKDPLNPMKGGERQLPWG
jgi:poly(3-hydroxybutyrate) depolymerase